MVREIERNLTPRSYVEILRFTYSVKPCDQHGETFDWRVHRKTLRQELRATGPGVSKMSTTGNALFTSRLSSASDRPAYRQNPLNHGDCMSSYAAHFLPETSKHG